MKLIKVIIGILVVLGGLYYAYFQFSTDSTPQECYTYQQSYHEALNIVKAKNTDGSLDQMIQQLLLVGDQLDSALEGGKRFKKEDAENLRTMCVNNHQLNIQMIEMLKQL
ncbi:hypothetical protein [Wohlfahrtiimonas larvae]|uniref:Uncharacterized protein n=1 Tax=Wohlfahrtiimonas larvae TaxID=1157986 RepID=A0ABP9MNP4_9GAMM|nr:hypothetical protein [Wohlfahrtiimonas larvae]